MPSPTYVAIAKTVLTGTQATVTFSSIPSTYTDLVLLLSVRQNAATYWQNVNLTFNNDTSSIYSMRTLTGAGSVTGSFSTSAAANIVLQAITGDSATANSFNSGEIYIPNYAGSTNKPISSIQIEETNDTSNNRLTAQAGLYSSTNAINRIDLATTSGAFMSGSRFDLYGIKNS